MAYLRVLVNPADDVSLRRIINTPRRAIGDATIAELARAAAQNGVPIFNAMLEPPETLASRARKSVGDFAQLLTWLMALRESMPLSDFVQTLIEKTRLEMQYLKEDSEEARTRVENIHEFIGAVREYEEKADAPTLEAFLENVALVTDLDGMPENQQTLTLMTLHSATIRISILSWASEQGLFPSHLALVEGRIEEERAPGVCGRYGARGKRLYLSYAMQRCSLTRSSATPFPSLSRAIPSRLLDDEWNRRAQPIVNPPCVPREQIVAAPQRARAAAHDFAGGRSGALHIPGVQQGFSASLASRFAAQARQVALFVQPGDRVLHRKFGEGDVLEVRGKNGDCRVVIEFAAYGIKEFVASIAPIVKVDG